MGGCDGEGIIRFHRSMQSVGFDRCPSRSSWEEAVLVEKGKLRGYGCKGRDKDALIPRLDRVLKFPGCMGQMSWDRGVSTFTRWFAGQHV